MTNITKRVLARDFLITAWQGRMMDNMTVKLRRTASMNMRFFWLLCLAVLTIPSLNVQANDVVKYNGIPGSGKIQIYAHRAIRGLLPEQTLPAYIAALRLGVDYVDMDIGMTKDGVLIITHDLTCAKITGNRVAILLDGNFSKVGSFESIFKSEDERIRSFYNYNFIQ